MCCNKTRCKKRTLNECRTHTITMSRREIMKKRPNFSVIYICYILTENVLFKIEFFYCNNCSDRVVWQQILELILAFWKKRVFHYEEFVRKDSPWYSIGHKVKRYLPWVTTQFYRLGFFSTICNVCTLFLLLQQISSECYILSFSNDSGRNDEVSKQGNRRAQQQLGVESS